jgi:hypothetical protein
MYGAAPQIHVDNQREGCSLPPALPCATADANAAAARPTLALVVCAQFGLPEVMMLYEVWQRSPEFLMKQVQMADVMKHSAESLLDLFTGCFSGGISIPELGLGNAETKVVATAWNRHLLLHNNARIYSAHHRHDATPPLRHVSPLQRLAVSPTCVSRARVWRAEFRAFMMQATLWAVALLSTSLSVLLGNPEFNLKQYKFIDFLMLIAPIISALLGTIMTRLRQQQKFAVCKMASFEIVSEIYKFRVVPAGWSNATQKPPCHCCADALTLRVCSIEQRAIEYDPMALAKSLMPKTDDKKKDDEIVPPIPAKEKDRLARRTFVERVQMIYTKCMEAESPCPRARTGCPTSLRLSAARPRADAHVCGAAKTC